MAHMEKFTKASLGHMFKHFDRGKDANGEPVKYSNQNIDLSRSQLNYNLAPHPRFGDDKIQGERMRDCLKRVHYLNRKDVNFMVGWIVTLPKNVPSSDEEKFFRGVYEFLRERYGVSLTDDAIDITKAPSDDNIISAYVHKDEVTPHMHFGFVPLTNDDKHGGGYKVSAKDVVNQSDLRTFHKDLERHMEHYMGYRVEILNDETREGNKSIDELKRGTAQETLRQLQTDIQNAYVELNRLNRRKTELEAQTAKYDKLYDAIEKGYGAVMHYQGINSLPSAVKNFVRAYQGIKPDKVKYTERGDSRW